MVFLWYFAYGSNLWKQQMQTVLNRKNFEIKKAVLNNYALKFILNDSDKSYATIVKSKKSVVKVHCIK
jgi:cation transport regulator ChaC